MGVLWLWEKWVRENASARSAEILGIQASVEDHALLPRACLVMLRHRVPRRLAEASTFISLAKARQCQRERIERFDRRPRWGGVVQTQCSDEQMAT